MDLPFIRESSLVIAYYVTCYVTKDLWQEHATVYSKLQETGSVGGWEKPHS